MFLKSRIPILTKTLRRLFHQALPSTCLLCGHFTQQSSHFCSACYADLPKLPPHCQRCLRALPAGKVCGACLSQPPPFDHIHALFPYQGPIIQLIIQLKFQQQLAHARAFADLFITAIRDTWYVDKPLPDIILPLPLHPTRLRERGFNQAVEIAKPIASALQLPLDRDGMKRIKATLAQSTLSAKERRSNVNGAFATTVDYSGLSIALLDDVITTGHTVSEISRVLKQHGAKHIVLWCSARCDIALMPNTR